MFKILLPDNSQDGDKPVSSTVAAIACVTIKFY